MFRNWTFGRKVGSGFAATIVALVVIAIAGLQNATTANENAERVAHTHIVQREVAELLALIVTAETYQRGFVITADESFLGPYTTALAAIDKAYDHVRTLTSDNPAQTRALDTLRPLIDQRLAVLKRGIDDRRTLSLVETAARIAQSSAKELMERIRTILTQIDAEESRLLKLREIAADASSEATKLVILWGAIIAVTVTVVIGWLIISSLTNQLGSSAQHIQSSSTELQAASNQQATGARQQATAMTEIATTISELLATSRQIADSSKRVSQIAAQTASAARTGDTTVTKGHEATTTMRKQVDLIVSHMLELGKKSQQVGSVLDIVAELAEQTNILAINATIEAAGAGDTGRRFGVVADEIRKLADRVAASTKEIRTMIDDVRGAVNTTVMATEAGSKAVDASTAQVLEMAGAFQEIANLVGTTTDAAREIELSTKQQATAVEQVNIAITTVAGATRETEASASQTLQTAAQLTDLSARLLRIVQTRAS
jgi:methyl-accepting chemotaxis protein